ncbi:hypothetical protein HDU99_010047 [Rhizoclosmatium hyalinum]|nr:hypothetical protein HDU99_010047 [Rhizoclosmatium hyalinum]
MQSIPNPDEIFKLLQHLSSEVSSLKKAFAESQSSLTTTIETRFNSLEASQRQVLCEIEKIRNPSKKHYTRITSLPKEVVSQIMSWIHPIAVWKLRKLSRAFHQVLTSKAFISLNIDRFALPVDTSIQTSTMPLDSDLLFLQHPSMVYKAAYICRFMSHLTGLTWGEGVNKPLPFTTSWLGQLSGLRILHWNFFTFQCKIPAGIASLVQLEELDLSYCQFTGVIPSWIGNLSFLRVLALQENTGLNGCLPPELGNLSLLEVLSIYDSNVMGPIPPELGNLKNLRDLHLGLKLNPDVPTIFPAEFGKLTRLERLCLAECFIVGNIPRELGQLVRLNELLLNGNLLTGEVPVELSRLPHLNGCELYNNAELIYSFEVPDHWGV